MGLERPTVWIILAVVALALFGYERLPDASRSVGRSLRIFKSELKGMAGDDEQRATAQTPVTGAPVTPPAAQPVPPDSAAGPAAGNTAQTARSEGTSAPRAD